MKHGILMHAPTDDVGVAVRDLEAGSEIGAVTLEGQPVCTVWVFDNVPLGHKIAIRELAAEQQVTEYGQAIGAATQAIRAGEHVHTHNIQTLRWHGRPLLAEKL